MSIRRSHGGVFLSLDESCSYLLAFSGEKMKSLEVADLQRNSDFQQQSGETRGVVIGQPRNKTEFRYLFILCLSDYFLYSFGGGRWATPGAIRGRDSQYNSPTILPQQPQVLDSFFLPGA